MATTVASGIVVAWPSTNASIPAGWAEKTAWASKYLRIGSAAGGTDVGTTGGNATHNHAYTGGSFTFTGTAHTHNGLFGTHASSGGIQSGGAKFASAGQGYGYHGHAASVSSSATAGATSTGLVPQAANNELARWDIIYIESNGTPTGIPNNAVAFFDSDTFPGSWSRVNGNGYLKSVSSGGDGASSQTGSNTHTHADNCAITGDKHAHSTATSGNSTEPLIFIGWNTDGFIRVAQSGHTHNWSIHTGQDSVSSSVSVPTASSEPAAIKINMIQNGTGGNSLPDQIIAIWTSTDATIPTDWARLGASYDGNYIKASNANGEVGNTAGGAAGHQHTGITISAISNGHDHADATATSAPSSTKIGPSNPGIAWAASNHGHNGNINVLNKTVTYTNVTGKSYDASSSEAHYPEFVYASLIKFTKPPGGARPSLQLMGVGA